MPGVEARARRYRVLLEIRTDEPTDIGAKRRMAAWHRACLSTEELSAPFHPIFIWEVANAIILGPHIMRGGLILLVGWMHCAKRGLQCPRRRSIADPPGDFRISRSSPRGPTAGLARANQSAVASSTARRAPSARTATKGGAQSESKGR